MHTRSDLEKPTVPQSAVPSTLLNCVARDCLVDVRGKRTCTMLCCALTQKYCSSWPETNVATDFGEGELVNAGSLCVASVQSTGKVMELREDKARWFRVKREAELAKCRFSKDCEGCHTTASGDEVSKRHGKECRERIRV